MKLKEEKELQSITEQFTAALQLFHSKEYAKAEQAFAEIIATYKESDSYSVQEIYARSKVYHTIANALLHPHVIELSSREDHLQEAVYQLNAGNVQTAMELLKKIEKESGNDPYYQYVTAIVHFRLDQTEQALQHLGRAIKMDATYKVLAYNEPDFQALAENAEFLKIVE